MKKNTKRAWIVFVGCCVISFIGMGLVLNTSGLYIAPLTAEFGVSATAVSGSLAVMTLAMMVGMGVAGGMIGKIDIKVLISVCTVLTSVGLLICSFAKSVGLIYVGQVLVGLGMTLLPGILTNILLGNWFTLKLGTVIGITAGVSGLGGAVFNPLVSLFITQLGWRNSYRLTGLLVLIICIPVTLITIKLAPQGDEVAYGAGKTGENGKAVSDINIGMTFKEAVRNYKFYLLLMSGIFLTLFSGFVQQLSNHAVSIGYTLTVGASVMSGVMIGVAAGKFIMGYLLDTIKPVVVIIIYAIIGIAGWLGLSMVSGQTMLMGVGVLVGMGQAILLVAVPFVSRKVFGGKEYAKISATQGIFTGLIGVVSSLLAAAMYDASGSYNSSFILAAVLILISSPLLIIAYKKRTDFSKEQ